jgi:site-specific DNA-methyltransferase (adenine-specific)
MKKMEDESVDLVVADPPYRTTQYITKKKWGPDVKALSARKKTAIFDAEWDRFTPEDYAKFTDDWILEIFRVLKQKGTAFIHCILTGEWLGVPEVISACKKSGFGLLNNISWAKPNAQPNLPGARFSFSTEQILWVSKGGKGKRTFNYQTLKSLNGGKQMRDYWIIPTEPTRFEHPSVKPLNLVQRMVVGCSNKDDLILDPFVGSGTTQVACEKLERNSIGIEISKEYCELAYQRLKKEVNQIKIGREKSTMERIGF